MAPTPVAPTVGSDAQVAHLALRLVILAETFGLLPPSGHRGVDGDRVVDALDAFADVGIGRHGAALAPHVAPDRLGDVVREALAAVEESPLPEHEWAPLGDVLGDDLLAGLVGTSVSSVHRYRSGERPTPDAVAARVHVVGLITADLAGSYNDFGVRRWFRRERSALGGASPADVLSADWTPDDDRVREVRALAGALLGSPAT
jgi:hypothetical protein